MIWSDIPPHVADIQGIVAKAYGVSRLDIISHRRGRALEARKRAMWIARRLTGLSYPALGRAFDRSHTTVLHNVRSGDQAGWGMPPAAR